MTNPRPTTTRPRWSAIPSSTPVTTQTRAPTDRLTSVTKTLTTSGPQQSARPKLQTASHCARLSKAIRGREAQVAGRAERQVLRVTTTTIIELALALALVGCGAPAEDDHVPTGPVTSEHGLYVADLSFEPNPPSVGENTLELWLRAAGEPVAGATVDVEAYMP